MPLIDAIGLLHATGWSSNGIARRRLRDKGDNRQETRVYYIQTDKRANMFRCIVLQFYVVGKLVNIFGWKHFSCSGIATTACTAAPIKVVQWHSCIIGLYGPRSAKNFEKHEPEQFASNVV